jgi:hypothetical protein
MPSKDKEIRSKALRYDRDAVGVGVVVELNERGSHGKDRRLPKCAVRDSGIPRIPFYPFPVPRSPFPVLYRSTHARISVSWSPRGKREGWIAISAIYAHWHDPIPDFFQKCCGSIRYYDSVFAIPSHHLMVRVPRLPRNAQRNVLYHNMTGRVHVRAYRCYPQAKPLWEFECASLSFGD